MNPIAIVIPTLKPSVAEDTGNAALATAACSARVIVSHDPDRTGFTATCNRGIKRAKKDEDICLLNDDITRFHYGWLGTMAHALYSNRTFGIAGPSGKSSTAPMCHGRLGERGIKVVNHIPFWCALIKRKLIDKLGLLDEAFIHYASDNWYCHQARRAGFKCIWVRDVFLEHTQHASGLITKWRDHDQRLYRRRIGR